MPMGLTFDLAICSLGTNLPIRVGQERHSGTEKSSGLGVRRPGVTTGSPAS